MSAERFDQAAGPTPIPAITGMHDGAAMAAARDRLAQIFAEALRKPAAAEVLADGLQRVLADLHCANARLFGWRDAEVIRAEALAHAVDTTVPQPDVIEHLDTTPGGLQP